MASEKDKIKEIIKKQAKFVELTRQRSAEIEQTQRVLKENFGSLQNALEKLII